jgi:hypothetical protein
MRGRARIGVLVAALLLLPASGVLAFFLAGALVFPIVESYYLPRVLMSFGFMAFAYGVESVITGGLVETCGFISGNCTTHNLRHWAHRLWPLLFVAGVLALLWWVRRLQK